MAKVIEEEVPRLSNPEDFETQVREYLKLKASMDFMESRVKELRTKIFEKMDLDGDPDDKGNINLFLDQEIDGVSRLEKQRRVSRKLNEALAETIIDEAGIGDEVYETKRVINEDALMAAFYEEKITEEQLEDMFPATITWALRAPKK